MDLTWDRTPDLRGERPATNRLSHGTALEWSIFQSRSSEHKSEARIRDVMYWKSAKYLINLTYVLRGFQRLSSGTDEFQIGHNQFFSIYQIKIF
jgi:hypothetical protein